MISLIRIYDLVPGGLAEYRAAVEAVGLPVCAWFGRLESRQGYLPMSGAGKPGGARQ